MFQLGYIYKQPSQLLTVKNAKTVKGEKYGYITHILYMSPEKQNTKGKNICPKATEGCAASCLFTAGRGRFQSTMIGRLNKTEYFLRDRNAFMNQLAKDIGRIVRNNKTGNKIAIRLNGTSDIPYENIPVGGFKNIMEMYPTVQFYDYTKIISRLTKKLPKNYHLTFSYAETEQNHIDAQKALNLGFNIAAVFAVKNETELPQTYKGFKVVNGDAHDLIFKHKSKTDKGLIIGLKAKGKAKKDTTGFVIRGF